MHVMSLIYPSRRVSLTGPEPTVTRATTRKRAKGAQSDAKLLIRWAYRNLCSPSQAPRAIRELHRALMLKEFRVPDDDPVIVGTVK